MTIKETLPDRPVNVRIITVDDSGHTINRTSFLRDPRKKDELGILDSEYLSVIPGTNWYTFVLLDKAAVDEKGE